MSKMAIWDRSKKEFIKDTDRLMQLSGLDLSSKYEAVGAQDDGTPVVFDKCGRFGYLDPQIYRCVIDLSE